jgi:hypothetical protein
MTTEASATGGQGAATATTAAAATSTAATTSTTTTTAAPAIAWLPDADETTVGMVQNKGWDSPAKLLNSYQQLEKFVGAPADKIVRLPGETSTKEELDAFYSKLGRPADPNGYEIKAPQGADDTFAKAAAGKFHELGLNTKQAQELVQWYESQGAAAGEMSQQAKTAANVEQQNALRTEWGAAYDAKLTQAREFARAAGIDAPTLDKLQDSMGYDGVMKFMANLGGKIGEGNYQSGGRSSNFSAMTPGQAKAEIQALRADRDFTQKYLAGNVEAKQRMAQLNSWAYPE